jgi:hypothetical protein
MRLLQIVSPRSFTRWETGLRLAYGADFSDSYRQAAGFVGNIFKGAKLADLPIQQPNKVSVDAKISAPLTRLRGFAGF